MKKLFPLVFLVSFSALASDLSLTLKCETNLTTDGAVATLTEKPIKLSTDGKNAKVFRTILGTDQKNAVVVALDESGGVCNGSNCSDLIATQYKLIIARVEDPTENALQMMPKAKIQGETSASARITVGNDGKIQSDIIQNGKLQMNVQGLPSELGFSYKISRKHFSKQNVEVTCSISQD